MVKQIEEMARIIFKPTASKGNCERCGFKKQCSKFDDATDLYNAGYRKQKEGEWTRVEVNGKNYGQVYYQHKNCSVNETQLFPSPYHFCPNCGAKMKGATDGKAD